MEVSGTHLVVVVGGQKVEPKLALNYTWLNSYYVQC